MKFLLSALLSIIVLFSSVITAQHEEQISETESTVPELTSYHKVVYPLWHKAYPDKNYDLFKKLQPEINSGAEKIYAAGLPGILRDKKNEWEEGVKKFRTSVSSYNKSIEENNQPEILASAEALHSNYEMLVRIVRPVTKEVDEYHKVLYMIFHHYLPENQTEQLSEAINQLMMRADSLKSSVLPKWAAKKQDEFKKQADKLYSSTKELYEIKDSDTAVINEAVDKVHDDYQKLEEVFD